MLTTVLKVIALHVLQYELVYMTMPLVIQP